MKTFTVWAVLATAILMLSGPRSTHADVVYDFTGQCTSPFGCDVPTFTAVLDLADGFVPGSIITATDVIGFEIDGHAFAAQQISIPYGPYYVPTAGTNVCGMPASTGCTGQNLGLTDLDNPGAFYSYGDGTWNFAQYGGHLGASGIDGQWTLVSPVPITGTGWLLIFGLGGLASFSRKARPASSAFSSADSTR